MTEPRYATAEEVAAYWPVPVSVETIRRMVRRGDLTAHHLTGTRIYRIDLNEVDKLIGRTDD